MLMRAGNNSSGPGRWLVRLGLSALLLAGPAFCWGSAQRGGQRGEHGWAGSHGRAAGFQSQDRRGQAEQRRTASHNRGERPAARQDDSGRRPQPQHDMRQSARPADRQAFSSAGRPERRSGQEHLPAWWQAHRGLSPQQQADALRRQPGFRNLPQRQQQRLIQRLHEFNRRPPVEQRRMLDRMETFEHLSPERQQEVRGASQALSRMPPARQRMMRNAFHELRGMPPEQRRQMLHSSFGARFTPQERTVLGNLLSIEPYQGQIIHPYFGRQ